ncbi:MFS transporter [Lentzea californiensis]|uniref:MFS transporter n=1 Tax=Lentzea californiensis TaxID=438851 RepID=UPI002164F886|nr:MFS transporter [Lentzea californiensis]MCR3754576.1 drug resistance transporter, EmrB/QacA subfamily [Lentzea californiensis]
MWSLTALSLAMLLPSLSTSIATVGLPSIATAFDAPFGAVQWVVIAYLLATTTLIVGVGRLGDAMGRRRVLLGGIAVFTVATLLCGLAPNLPFLIAARAVQGAGAACMMALTMAMAADAVPEGRTGAAMGLLGTTSAVGTALGPALGGVLVGAFGWRAIFFVIVPLGVLAFALARQVLPGSRRSPAKSRFDAVGTALLAIALGAYAVAVTVGSASLAVGLLVTAVAGFVAFVLVERRVAAPLVDIAMVRDPVLAAGLTTSALVTTIVMTTLVVGPFHLAGTLDLAPALVGLVMSAGPAVSALTGVPAGRAADRFGSGAVVVVGLGGVLCGTAALSVMPTGAGVLGYLLPLVTVTSGYALFQAANNTAVMGHVPAHERGVVSGMLNLSRNLGLITGASVMGAVFAFAAGTTDVTAVTPVESARATHWTFGVAAMLALLGLGVMLGVRRRTH